MVEGCSYVPGTEQRCAVLCERDLRNFELLHARTGMVSERAAIRIDTKVGRTRTHIP